MEWVKCNDRLPVPEPGMNDALVLAFAEGRTYAMHYYPPFDGLPGAWACAQGDGWGVPSHRVTHWMPMPAPPAAESA
jgi:hypothetical protein